MDASSIKRRSSGKKNKQHVKSSAAIINNNSSNESTSTAKNTKRRNRKRKSQSQTHKSKTKKVTNAGTISSGGSSTSSRTRKPKMNLKKTNSDSNDIMCNAADDDNQCMNSGTMNHCTNEISEMDLSQHSTRQGQSRSDDQPQTLQWASKYSPIPLSTETSILPILMQYGKKENGMFKYQKQYRLQKVKKSCYENKIRLDQALSLRRHHIANLNPFCNMTKLGLGSYDDIKGSSELFEKTLESYLRDNDISFIDETEQIKNFHQRCKEIKKASNSHNGEEEGKYDTNFKMPPTPDFILSEKVQIEKSIVQNPNHYKSKTNNSMRFDINWIDAKMFYGASSIQPGTKNAVGTLLAKAKKYVKHYGQGAFVFFNGYGDELEKVLLQHGVVALDAAPLELRPVFEHQRTWCANKNGEILP